MVVAGLISAATLFVSSAPCFGGSIYLCASDWPPDASKTAVWTNALVQDGGHTVANVPVDGGNGGKSFVLADSNTLNQFDLVLVLADANSNLVRDNPGGTAGEDMWNGLTASMMVMHGRHIGGESGRWLAGPEAGYGYAFNQDTTTIDMRVEDASDSVYEDLSPAPSNGDIIDLSDHSDGILAVTNRANNVGNGTAIGVVESGSNSGAIHIVRWQAGETYSGGTVVGGERMFFAGPVNPIYDSAVFDDYRTMFISAVQSMMPPSAAGTVVAIQ
jgi:hypothetical protein